MKTKLAVFALLFLVLAASSLVVSQDRFRSNGERIYYTRTNDAGEKISFEGGPDWLKGSEIGCVACHGPEGEGGFLIWPSMKTAPDIRYNSLIMEEHKHGGETETHPRYTDDLIKRAITEGINAGEEPLDSTMPRWELSGKDFEDLISYLKRLSEGIEPLPQPYPKEEDGRR